MKSSTRYSVRVEGQGHIRWWVHPHKVGSEPSVLVRDVTMEEYYRGGHVHPSDCKCDALVHDEAFHEALQRDVRTALAQGAT